MYYEIITPPSNLPVSLDTVKMHLKLDSGTYEDTYLTSLIKAVASFGEKYTGREFLTKTSKLYLDSLPSGMEIEKSKLQTIDEIKYSFGGVFISLTSLDYSIIKDNLYSKIYLNNSVAVISSDIPQGVQITFKAGYGTAETNLPDDIKLAMLHHINKIYASRGDSEENLGAMSSIISSNLPLEALQVYNLYKIEDISI